MQGSAFARLFRELCPDGAEYFFRPGRNRKPPTSFNAGGTRRIASRSDTTMKHLAKFVGATTSVIVILASAQAIGATSNNNSPLVSPANAQGPNVQTGQPSQTCGVTTPVTSPSAAAGTSPGSAFNPAGVADGKYAGTQSVNTINAATVSQYDVACSKQPPSKIP